MDEKLRQAVGLCFLAISTPQLWPAALQALGAAIAASAISPSDNVNAAILGRAVSTEGYRQLLEASFNDGWNLGGDRPADGSRPGAAAPGGSDPRPEIPDLATLAVPARGGPFAVSVPPSVSPEASSEAVPFASTSWELRSGMSQAGRQRFEGTSKIVWVLDDLLVPAVLLDDHGSVVQTTAHVDVAPGSGLRITRGYLAAEDAASNLDLQRLIHEVVDMRASAERPAPEPAVIRRSAQRPLVIEALSTGRPLASSYDGSAAMLLISNLERRTIPVEAHVRRVFDLTNSELKLVMLIAHGEDLSVCGDILGWSRETTRSVLKTVFSKTETHRQAELVALLCKMRTELAVVPTRALGT